MNHNRIASGVDKNLELKKQVSNKSGESNISAKPSDKLVGKILNTPQDKNVKPEIKKESKSDVTNTDVSESTDNSNNLDNENIIKRKESEKKELKNIENFFDKRKENQNR